MDNNLVLFRQIQVQLGRDGDDMETFGENVGELLDALMESFEHPKSSFMARRDTLDVVLYGDDANENLVAVEAVLKDSPVVVTWRAV